MPVERFLEHLAFEKRASPLTVKAYRSDLEQFSGFLKEELGVDDPTATTDKAVRVWMMRLLESGVSARSVNRKLSALRAYFHFARMVGVVQADPTALIDPPKTPTRLPEFVAERNMERLLDWAAGGHIRAHVHATIPLERWTEAYALIADRKAKGKIVLTL